MVRVLRSPFVSALIGGLVVGGAFLVSGVAGRSHTETIFTQSPVANQSAVDPVSGPTLHSIYQRNAPGVVFVRAKLLETIASPFNLTRTRESGTSTGAGFLVDRRGDILTNYHIIDGADRSRGVTVQFEERGVHSASVVAVDPSDDLAVLRSDMHGVSAVRPLALGDSTTVRVGDPTLTIGNPFGVDRTLTSGIVAALQHEIQAADGRTINNVIQTDQPVSAGNSGAPLLDADGRVIGINSQMAIGGDQTSQRVAFAIPIDTADSVLSRVDKQAALKVAYLGVTAAPSRSRAAVVGVVAPGSPAAAAGLRRGDTIQRIDATPVDSIRDVLAIVATRSPGQPVSLQIRRGRRHSTLQVTLGSRSVPSDKR
ncbi:MAG TPA: S1C family serine protease [Solirubrobacteraceae bacterium]|nr:S1C family serine protease [Solirubrobacteraceae bacterium]